VLKRELKRTCLKRQVRITSARSSVIQARNQARMGAPWRSHPFGFSYGAMEGFLNGRFGADRARIAPRNGEGACFVDQRDGMRASHYDVGSGSTKR
jgi:hypothetical protein